MGDNVERQLTYVITAKDAGASAVLDRTEQQIKKLRLADYKSEFRNTVSSLKTAGADDIQRMTETGGDRRGRQDAAASQRRLREAQEESARITAEAQEQAEKEKQIAAKEARELAEEERKATRQRRQHLAGQLLRERDAGFAREAGQYGNIAAEERNRFRNTASPRRGPGGPGGGGGSGGGGGGGEGGEGEGGIAGLNDAFGRRSAAGKIGRILEGGGAVFGLAIAAKIIGDVTAKAVELKKAFDDDGKSAHEIADELARSIPIYGQLYAAGQNIQELRSGELATAQKLKDAADAQNGAIEARIALLKQEKEEHYQTDKTVRETNQKVRGMDATGAKRVGIDNATEHENLDADLSHDVEEKKAALDAKFKAQREAFQSVINKAVPERTFAGLTHGDNKQDRDDLLDAQANAQARLADLDANIKRSKDTLDVDKGRKLRADSGVKDVQNRKAADKDDEEYGRQKRERDKSLDNERAASSLERARAMGREADQEKVEIDRKAKQQKEDINIKLSDDEKALTNKGALTTAREKELADNASGSRDNIDVQAQQQKDEIDRRESMRKLEHDYNTERDIRQDRIHDISDELAAGDFQHAKERKQLELDEEFAARRLALERRKYDDHASAAEKAKAQKDEDALPFQKEQTQKRQQQRDMEDDRLKFLHLQAEAGSREAGVMAKKLEIQRQYKEEAQLLKSIKDDHSDEARSAQAKEALDKLGQSENAALRNAAMGNAIPQLATAINGAGGGVRGFAMAARERAFLDKPHIDPLGIGKGNDATAKNTAATAKGIGDLIKAVENVGRAITNSAGDGGDSLFGSG